MKKALIVIIIICYVASILAMAFYTIQTIKKQYMPETQIEAFFLPDQTNLVIGSLHIKDEPPPVVKDNEILLPFDVIKKHIDPTIFLDEGRARIIITTPDKVVRLHNDELEAFVNHDTFTLDMAAQRIDGVLYVPIMVFKELFAIDVVYHQEKDVVLIDHWKNYEHVGVLLNEDAVIRSGPSIKNTIYKAFDINENQVTVFENRGNWSKVRTSEGIIGYVQSHLMYDRVQSKQIDIYIQKQDPSVPKPIILAWEYIHQTTPPAENIQKYEGLNVLSPTWFTVVDAEGTIESKADVSYVDKAYELGYEVWPLVNNVFSDIETTSAFLNDSDAREHIIQQLIAYAKLYGFGGINIDFENIYLRDQEVLTQFMRELVPFAHMEGLIISIDVGVPDGSDTYSRVYDHQALGQVADYVMVMTYDQHWATSPQAGSQAQLSWMKNRLERTLEMIPQEKLVLGIPFYSRVWQLKDGNVRNIASVTMDRAQELIEENNALVTWDETSGQYVVQYTIEDANYIFWMEDPTSVGLKAQLAKEYQLAGVAIWALAQGNQDAWVAINESMFKGDDE